MSDLILPGDPDIAVILRRSPRAKRISLRISQLDGRVTLTLPPRCPEAEAFAFAREKAEWIRGHLETRQPDVAVRHGSALPIGGQMHDVAPATGRKVLFETGRVLVPGPADRVGPRLMGHLKTLARIRLTEASDRYAQALGLPYTAITLRDTRSRWGSCTSEGRLMYSWRLIMCPPEVLDYVAAHEVAHLREMNHSAAFWHEVKGLYGDYAAPRQWLRRQGSDLHRYRFDS